MKITKILPKLIFNYKTLFKSIVQLIVLLSLVQCKFLKYRTEKVKDSRLRIEEEGRLCVDEGDPCLCLTSRSHSVIDINYIFQIILFCFKTATQFLHARTPFIMSFIFWNFWIHTKLVFYIIATLLVTFYYVT